MITSPSAVVRGARYPCRARTSYLPLRTRTLMFRQLLSCFAFVDAYDSTY